MRQLILISSILLLLIGAWGCSENTEQSAKEAVGAAEQKATDATETVQAGAAKATEEAAEKAKKVIEEMKAQTEGSTDKTKE